MIKKSPSLRTFNLARALLKKALSFPSGQRRVKFYFEDDDELDRERATVFDFQPQFSVVVHPANPQSAFLACTLESMKYQTYPRWELRLPHRETRNPSFDGIAGSPIAEDRRIKAISLLESRDTSEALKEILLLASGDFLLFINPGDLLAPSALFETVRAINDNRDAHFIYSDYARIDEHDRVTEVALCPQFSRFFYLSHPYAAGLVAIRKTLFDQAVRFGPFSADEKSATEGDLFLRTLALLDDRSILHIPKILYFSRSPKRAQAPSVQEKARTSRKNAISKYFKLKKMDAWVEDGLTSHTFRVRFPIKNEPLVSIIIPTRGKGDLLEQCVKSIEAKSGYSHYEILVVRNRPEKDNVIHSTVSAGGGRRILVYDLPFNYSAINNYAARFTRGDFLLFLNDDIRFRSEGTLTALLELVQLREVGIVGAKLLYPDETIQHTGVILGLFGTVDHWHRFTRAYRRGHLPEPGYLSSLVSIREYSAVTGACLMTKKALFDEVGGFSEALEIGFNDIDFCLKVRAKGYKVLCTPYAMAYHIEMASRADSKDSNVRRHPHDTNRFLDLWGDTIRKGDPFYHPNLDLSSYVPSPRW